MSIHSGSFSITRYRTLGARSDYKINELNQKLKVYQARPLKLEGIHIDTIKGWVRPIGIGDDDLPDDAHWDMSDCGMDLGFMLRFRVERRKVPTGLLQLILRDRLRGAAADNQGQPVGRKRRKEIMDELKAEMLAKALPNLTFVDALWRDKANDIFLFSTSKKDAEFFEELFKKTFAEPLGFTIIKVTPPLLGLDEGEWDGKNEADISRLERLSSTIPSDFALS